jgi:hypothetical protein
VGSRWTFTLSAMRPAHVCSQLLAALDASEGRRRRRRRDTTPDAIGLALKRTILEETVRQDPDPEVYEQWLTGCCSALQAPSGPSFAMARDVLSEWYLALRSSEFRSWLEEGARSDDAPPPAAE